jgi:hypothetical protein
MERLPYIDDHAREIEVSPEQVWAALLATLRSDSPKLPKWLTAAWGLQHPTRIGTWNANVAVGDTLTGFAAVEVEAFRVLTLRGRHRFSDYELRFELERLATGRTRLHAKSSAAFPGIKGRVYRGLVIGTRGHRVAVRRILAQVARRAERPS